MAVTNITPDEQHGDAVPMEDRSGGRQRIVFIDVLRGVALLGLIVMNVESFSGPEGLHDIPVGTANPAFVGWHAGLDYALLLVKWTVFEGKMRALFGMLFGASTILLIENMEAGDQRNAADVFCRRNLWLLLFGLLHGTLIWQGDILSQYAIVALLLLYPLRRVAAGRLVAIGIVMGVVGGSLGGQLLLGAPAVYSAERAVADGNEAIRTNRMPSMEQRDAMLAFAKDRSDAPARIADAVRAGRATDWGSVGGRAAGFLDLLMAYFRTGYALEYAGSMVLGMGLFRSGFFTGRWSKRSYLQVAGFGYAASFSIVLVGLAVAKESGFAGGPTLSWLFLPYPIAVLAGAVAHACTVQLAYRAAWSRRPAALLAQVGRTAFTNYISTSLLCQWVFVWGPWKLFGAIQYHEQVYVIAAVWVSNLLGSAIWLRFFRTGPLEWLWRTLVFAERQPFRRADDVGRNRNGVDQGA